MAESVKHTALVQIIISYIGREHAHITALGVINDLSSPLHAEKPNRIDGFVPDVYAFDAPLTTVIIGEAKTQDDLETEHSRKQITAYSSLIMVSAPLPNWLVPSENTVTRGMNASFGLLSLLIRLFGIRRRSSTVTSST